MDAGTPLHGVRVLDCSGWNGVFAARLLADAGADVVRAVPTTGDPLDLEPPFFRGSAVSIQATWYNAGKRVVTLDAGTETGREALLELAAAADILLEDWPAGAAPLTGNELRAANPGLVQVSVTPMGLNGPLAAFRTNDLVANALCGSAFVTGNADTPPLTGYGNQTYHTVGLYAAICALSALRTARATGEYQHVDLSAHEALATCTEQVLMQWFFPEGPWATPIARRQGSLHWSTAYEVYPARDGLGVMVTAALRFFDVLLPWLLEDGAAQGLADPHKYPDFAAMIADLPYVMKVLREWVATHDAEPFFYEAQKRHQPFGVVWDIETAVKSPQITARRYFQPQFVDGVGAVAFPGRLFRTSADVGHPSPPRRLQSADVGWGERSPLLPAGGAAAPGAPLAGVRILDFTHVLAGPFGTRVLGDLGAEVIKITAASRGGGANVPEHPYYVCWNRNKQSVTLNMAMEEARHIARKLAEQSDIIIENFSPGVLKRWGLDRASIAKTNPGVSVITMGGMGQDGPWKDFVTFAPTIHAVTGLTYLTNPPGRHDLGYGFSLTDHLSGLAGALAAVEALHYRDRTGQGLEIDLAQYELGLGLLAPALLDHLANGVNPEPTGNRHPFGAWSPHGVYRCLGEDRWIAIAVRGDDQWRALCKVLDAAELGGDHRFTTHAGRLANVDALDSEIERRTISRDSYELMWTCQRAGIAAGAVQDAEDLTQRDQQLAAREFFGTASGGRQYGLDKFPACFNGVRPSVYDSVHEIGEDTFKMLTGLLGLSHDAIADLAAMGALT